MTACKKGSGGWDRTNDAVLYNTGTVREPLGNPCPNSYTVAPENTAAGWLHPTMQTQTKAPPGTGGDYIK